MIDGSRRVLDLVRDGPHGRLLVAVPDEHSPRGVQNPLTRILPLPRLRLRLPMVASLRYNHGT